MLIPLLFLFATLSGGVHSWDSQQLEVFDVVEEVKDNFYKFLSVPQVLRAFNRYPRRVSFRFLWFQDAEAQAIKSAYRRLTRELHPDKNSADNAEEQFRNLVSIYDVLKDPIKRQYYDEVLVNGLPNWRSAVYYYRKVRRVGLLELFVLLFVLITAFQYVIAWASYFERKYTLVSLSIVPLTLFPIMFGCRVQTSPCIFK